MWGAGERMRRTRARHRARGPCVTDLAHCEHRSLVVAVAAAVAAAVAGAAAEPRRRVCDDLRSRKRWSRPERVLRLVVAAVEATDMWSVVVLCSAAAPVVAGFARCCCCCTRRSDHVGCPKKTRESSRRSTEAAYCCPARCHRNVVDAPVDALVPTAGGTGGVCEVALAAPLNARERVPSAYW